MTSTAADRGAGTGVPAPAGQRATGASSARSPGLAEVLRHLGSGATLELPRALDGDPPTVTVVVPCYNYGHFLPAAVASVLGQDGVAADVVVVDDASPDGSVEVARALARSDARVTVVAHERNRGHIATYNDGLERVTGELCVLMSADDRLAPGALARAAALLRHHPEVGLVYGEAVEFTDEPPAVAGEARAWALWSGASWFERRARAGTNLIKSPEVVVRSSVQRQVGGYRAELPHSGDLDMWLRVASVSDVARVVGPAQAFYRVHAANMHTAVFERDSARSMVVDLEQRMLAFDHAAQFAQGQLAEADRLKAVARASLAEEALTLAARAHWWGHEAVWPVGDLRTFAAGADPTSGRGPAARRLSRAVRFGRRVNTLDELGDRLRERRAAALARRAGV
jgi:glycosyltransferase involved in cell wall biosynthesis